ncbi:helix-turn-helix domain-containing protein [Paenibacillus lutimineralis]|uniref:AraC family transcriptional regulator n=1 Tax=Paenibacillus lutimineralis TaxID=2707005 RepID=A0A3S9UXR4_9BACL|nr:helix-turn-helix domain-containing protein [Paenibacillus lutimineralis]AZS15132.1 AraC family transcriptional regulator [Paenibacillus lutimineralis]
MKTVHTEAPNHGSMAADHLHKTDLQGIRVFIGSHYDEPLSITQLAKMANISPKYFVDLFKKTFGQSAMEYLTDVRIQHAKRYLAESEERLRDIAKKVGYKDEFYFSRKFKKEVGVSPSEFAKNTRKRVAVCSPSAIGHLLALNIIPKIAPIDPKWTPYYYNLYSSKIKSHLIPTSPYYKLAFETNLGKLSQARPDVIIGSEQLQMSEDSRLNSIAPIHYITDQKGWRDQLLDIAAYLDKEAVAQQWIRNYESNVQAAREQLRSSLGNDRILVLRIYRTQMFAYRNRGLQELLYDDLNLQDACDRELHSHHLPMALQELQEINPERILLTICPEASTRKFWLALQHSAGWKQLQALQNGHVYMISADPWFEYSAMAMARMLDEVLLLFTGNCPNILLDNDYGESLVK